MSAETTNTGGAAGWIKRVFVRVGVLPFFLGIALITFTALSDKFLTGQNLINVARQSVYLVLVSMGQMLVLISGGFDLSVGTAIALTSVVSATGMVAMVFKVNDNYETFFEKGTHRPKHFIRKVNEGRKDDL